MSPSQPIHRRRGTGSILGREFRAGLAPLGSILGLELVLTLAGTLPNLFNNQPWTVRPTVLVVYCSSFMVAVILGTLCGAEEEENGTADFTRRLPVPALRIFGKKLAGTLLLAALWGLLSCALIVFHQQCIMAGPWGSYPAWDGPNITRATWVSVRQDALRTLVLDSALLCFGILMGVVLRGVILGACGAGLLFVFYYLLQNLILNGTVGSGAGIPSLSGASLFTAAVCAAALASAAIIFIRREGR